MKYIKIKTPISWRVKNKINKVINKIFKRSCAECYIRFNCLNYSKKRKKCNGYAVFGRWGK